MMSPLKSISWIVISLYLVTGGVYKGSVVIRNYVVDRNSSRNYLCRIVQTGPQKEALKTVCLAELIGISADQPTLFHQFDTRLAEKQLMASGVIQEAHVALMAPDTIYIDYTVRQPIALIADFENIALDEQGYPFPLTPFFTPKILISLYLGISEIIWNEPLTDPHTQLALTLLELFRPLQLDIKTLDVSNAFHRSLGRREIVVVVASPSQGDHYIRLTPTQFAQEMGNYLELRKQLAEEASPLSQMIDLRIPQLGFIEPIPKNQ